MVLFSDLARRTGLLYLSGYGLLIGRIGDSFGESACLLLEKRLFPLLGITGLFFIVAVFVLFRIFPVLYLPAAPAAGFSEKERGREIFQRFCAGYELSAREREVLQYLLEEKTGAEIADAMSISEGTVKYHIHNLLQKTGCRNRIALLDAYFSQGKE
ncbi:MAG: helix-turn-helix transcriptional regulator [Lachnospiraceae bacterium]|nr:helix-turn-helix transcriptional regulator [Lachnospiraceae bacterium]